MQTKENEAAAVDVLAVMGSDAHCAADSRSNHYDYATWAALSANSDRARAAVSELVEAAKLMQRLNDEVLPKFNWGASALDANAIGLLNTAPTALRAALSAFGGAK